mmetsp:Transcript_32872/g.79998  ORF Transcript_32872/g.79998 Transcript_32872/m.79998 type:complete len:93 (-) Transcript_32872:456-734(-)
MVLSRCAMMIIVRPCIIISRASWTNCSFFASRADVASSRMRILGFRIAARAIATRCFCPPESCFPRAPAAVSIPERKLETKSQFAISMADPI